MCAGCLGAGVLGVGYEVWGAGCGVRGVGCWGGHVCRYLQFTVCYLPSSIHVITYFFKY